MTNKFYTIKLSELLAAVEAKSKSCDHSRFTCEVADDFCETHFNDCRAYGSEVWTCLVREMYANCELRQHTIFVFALTDAEGEEFKRIKGLHSYHIRKEFFARLNAQLAVCDRTLVIPVVEDPCYTVPGMLRPVYA